MSSYGSSRHDFLIGKAGAEQITLKLQEEDPRVFLSNFQAANSILPSNDTSCCSLYGAFYLVLGVILVLSPFRDGLTLDSFGSLFFDTLLAIRFSCSNSYFLWWANIYQDLLLLHGTSWI